MPYLSFDLEAKKRVPKVAKAAGVEPGAVAWGLLELWEHAWETKAPVVREIILDGCFGPSERIREALVAHEFIEPTEGGWRVRGADRYLRITGARSEAGKTRTAKASRDSKGRLVAESVLSSSHPANAGEPASKPPALSSSIEHRASNTDDSKAEAEPLPPPKQPHAVRVYEAPTTESSAWMPEEFHAWAQARRQESGYFGEKLPNHRALGVWYHEALMSLGGRVDVLQEAFYRFGESKFWEGKDPPFPFKGFMSQWDKFVPRRAV